MNTLKKQSGDRAFGDLVIGDISAFFKFLFVPQFVVFILLILMGSLPISKLHILEEFAYTNTPSRLLLKFICLLSLFIINLYCQSALPAISLRLVRGEYIFLYFVLIGGALISGDSVTHAAYIPLSLIILSGIVLPLSPLGVVYIAVPLIALVIGVEACITVVLPYYSPSYEGIVLIVLSFFCLLLKSGVMSAIDATRYVDQVDYGVDYNGETFLSFKGKLRLQKLLNSHIDLFSAGLKREFVTSLFPLLLLSEILLILLPFLQGRSSLGEFAEASGVIVASGLALVIGAISSSVASCSLMFLASASFYLYFLVFEVDSLLSVGEEIRLGLLCGYILFSSYPFGMIVRLLYAGMLFFYVVLFAFSSQNFALPLTSGFFAILIMLLRSSRSYVGMAYESVHINLGRDMRSISSLRDMALILGYKAAMILESRKFIIVGNGEKGTLVDTRDGKEYEIDSVFSNGLVSQTQQRYVMKKGKACGFIRTDSLDEGFKEVFYRWFGYVPSYLYFFLLAPSSKLDGDYFMIFMPVWHLNVALGLSFLEKHLASIMKVSKIAEKHFREKPVKSTAYFPSRFVREDSDKEFDNEIASVIHFVNNSAQDISIVCSRLRELISGGKLPEELKGLSSYIDHLENAVRDLSSGVSDLVWLKELSRHGKKGELERVDPKVSIEGIIRFAQYRGKKKKRGFKFAGDLQDGTVIHVVGREYFEAVLRMIVRVSYRRLKKGDELVLMVEKKDEMLAISFGDNGEPKDSLSDLFNPYEKAINVSNVITNFMRNSGGDIRLDCDHLGFKNVVTLLFRSEDSGVSEDAHINGWILLVDDKSEILNFYSKVAQAFSAEYECALSSAEAIKKVEERGKPSLVITDVQLDGDNGFELVRYLRSEFSKDLPIIVVSGNIDDSLRESGGANIRFLTKPLTRRKLFIAIREFLQ